MANLRNTRRPTSVARINYTHDILRELNNARGYVAHQRHEAHSSQGIPHLDGLVSGS